MDPAINSGFTMRFLEQLLFPFRSEIVTVYSPALEIVMSLVKAVKPEGPVQ
jgi:hypothetical protein